MLKGKPNVASKAAEWFADFDTHLSHNRGLSRDQIKRKGIVVDKLETRQSLQDAVLSVHHATMHTFDGTRVAKIIENHEGMGNFWLKS